jgi:hypothetical protein
LLPYVQTPNMPAVALEWAQSTFDLLEGLAWPAVLALAFVLFRKPLSNLIQNTWRVRGPGGAELETHPRIPQEVDVSDTPPENLTGYEYEERLREIEQQYKWESEVVQQDYEETQKVAEQLRSRLAQAETALYYERIFRVAYGTQILLLEGLNAAQPAGLRREYVEAFYRRFLSLTYGTTSRPDTGPTLEMYIGFLRNEGLITVTEDDETFNITERGRAFLIYLTAAGIDHRAKPL